MTTPLAAHLERPVDMRRLYDQYPPLERVELGVDHRITERSELVNQLPRHRVGAEIGVYTGVFSEYLINTTHPQRFHMVDAYELQHGAGWTVTDHCDTYIDGGAMTYEAAKAAAQHRALKANLESGVPTWLDTAWSVEWLNQQPEYSLDWIYLDTSHDYDGTLNELCAASRVVKPEGVICGDDAWDGVFDVLAAVKDFTAASCWRLAYLKHGQYMLRRDN